MNTVIVTVRHPDFANETHTFGEPVTTVDIDMGASFDGAKLDWSEWDTVMDWALSHDAEADRLAGENQDAADFIRSVIEETLAECLPYRDDEVVLIEGIPYEYGSNNVRPYIDAAKRRGA